MMASYLENSVKFLAGVGERRAEVLRKELGIETLRDLLYYFPYRYIDRSRIYRIAEVADDAGAYIQLRVRVERFSTAGGGKKKRMVATVSDGSAGAELVWFSGLKWIEKQLEVGREYLVFGKPNFFNGTLSIVHPELEAPDAAASRGQNVQGIYSSTELLASNQMGTKGIYKLMLNLWAIAKDRIEETLPAYIMQEHGLIPLREALYNIHFPQSPQLLRQAEYRLKFEELFGIQLGILSRKLERQERRDGFVFSKVGDKFNGFYSGHLPFELTGAQKRVIKEIRSDTVTGSQMNRLLQGDVGSGKTLVALMSMLLACDNGFQSCLMAPTEILARQHYATIVNLLGEMDVRVAVLTGSTPSKERDAILADLQAGETDILVGTHALLEDRVVFPNLGFVVIDEQHRFGVRQRARLWQKNEAKPPHILVMTATPIPRTLAMTLYGDLDVSIIDELPPGRQPIKTMHARDSERLRVYGFIRQQIAAGRQVYIVYPLIFESEKMDYKDLQDGFEAISREFPPPENFVTVVHGKMKPADKEANMAQFKNGTAHIMVATSVIEVGVDVPNASVMIIESAERFGLSQLHQLRGRVGRGAEQSYCILMSGDKLSADAKARINAMVRTNDGFELSELDMKLRGPGDITGTQQSGLAFELKISNLAKDNQVVEVARDAARSVLESDPDLKDDRNSLLVLLRKKYFSEKETDFSLIS